MSANNLIYGIESMNYPGFVGLGALLIGAKVAKMVIYFLNSSQNNHHVSY